MKVNENIFIEWYVEDKEKEKLQINTNSNDAAKKIFFKVNAKLPNEMTLGIGFSGHGEVTNADFVVLWHDLQGVEHFQVKYLNFKVYST